MSIMKSNLKNILKAISYIKGNNSVYGHMCIDMHEHISIYTDIFTWNWSDVHVFISGDIMVV